jgi:lysophospholipase L1-like esterase
MKRRGMVAPVARIAVVLAAAITTTLAVTGAYETLSSPIRQSGQGPSIYVIGDSWSAGLYADPQHTLAQDAADDLGLQSIVNAQSGTGYLNAPLGTETYAERVAQIPAGTSAELVVLQGGSNDDGAAPATLLKAVAQTVTAARHAIPGATVVLLGPGPDPWPVTEPQTAVDDVLRLDALQQHVPYISPLQEGWFTSSNVATIIDPNTAHPTIRGDETLGQRLANDLRALVKKPNLPAPQSRRPEPQDSRLHIVGVLGRSARQSLAVTG